jgi:hypothetical protein
MRWLLFLVLIACGAAQSPSGAMMPTPYTAEQIRAANHVGRRLDWRVETAGRHEMRSMTFVAADEKGADAEAVTLDETGHAVGESKRTHATWEELRDHAAFPSASTTLTHESVTVPAGTYDCNVYTVTDGGKVMRFWFANNMPGPPVKMVTTEAGAETETRELARVIDNQ